MNVFGVIMRVYSYLFHLVLGLILIAISAVTLIGGAHNLKLGMLPWSGATLTYSLLALGALGVILVGLAVRGSLRIAFFLWSLVVVGFLVKGYIFSSYVFSGPGEFWKALIFILGSILAVVGAWFSWKQAPASR